jgi:hypothetical protein
MFRFKNEFRISWGTINPLRRIHIALDVLNSRWKGVFRYEKGLKISKEKSNIQTVQIILRWSLDLRPILF